MKHVDIVKNEWSAGWQTVIARVTAMGDERDRESGENFLRTIHERYQGDYLFATEPHEDADCPLPTGGAAMVALKP